MNSTHMHIVHLQNANHFPKCNTTCHKRTVIDAILRSSFSLTLAVSIFFSFRLFGEALVLRTHDKILSQELLFKRA